MPIPDEVKVSYLDQIYRRQRLAPLARPGDALPAPLVMIAERVEVMVEVSGSTFSAADLAYGHVSYPDIKVITYGRSPDLI
jgi:hypothetical protein